MGRPLHVPVSAWTDYLKEMTLHGKIAAYRGYINHKTGTLETGTETEQTDYCRERLLSGHDSA